VVQQLSLLPLLMVPPAVLTALVRVRLQQLAQLAASAAAAAVTCCVVLQQVAGASAAAWICCVGAAKSCLQLWLMAWAVLQLR
jgi:hypothetical protein